jgi:hypothetical protein
LNNSRTYFDGNIIRFRQWSHKSYAVFCSIGKQIHIGFLSAIIQKINTVKSSLFQFVAYFQNELDIELKDNNELITESDCLLALGIDLDKKYILVAGNNRVDQSRVESLIFIMYNNVKAFKGLFYCHLKSLTEFLQLLYNIFRPVINKPI